MGALGKLKGLGEKTELYLNEIGIFTKEDLQQTGVIRVFLNLKQEAKNHKGRAKPSLCFLYAMVGALEDRHWADIAKTEKGRLLLELEDYQELEEILKAEGVILLPPG